MKKIMWILNITPDSFYDWWSFVILEEAKSQIEKMISSSVDIIDVWGFSSRPWSKMPSVKEELERILPILEYLETLEIEVSVDTCRSEVVKEILKFKNLKYINDISWLSDEKILSLISGKNIAYILMHILWIPENMQNNIKYENILEEISSFFEEKIKIIKSYGVEKIILDPWFGFWKELHHNYEILKNLEKFKNLWFPVLAWISRKSMIYKMLDSSPCDVLAETVALNFLALQNWADILRVHDVKENKNILKIYEYMKNLW